MSESTHRGVHPDADLLSAFAEGVLPENERVACMDHLAECAQCREIIYLVQGDVVDEPAPVPVAPPARVPLWKRWLVPVSALGTIAASLLVVSITSSRHETALVTPKPELMAKVEEQPRAEAIEAEPKQAATPAPDRMRTAAAPKTEPRPMAFDGVVAASAPVQVPAPAALPAVAAPQSAPAVSEANLTPPPKAAPLPALSLMPSQPVAVPPTGVGGTITDSAGAAVTNAQVKLTDSSKSNTFTSATDSSGQYSVDGIPPGHYQLSIQSAGFKSAVNEVDVRPQQIAKADSVLSLGGVADSILVTAEAAPVQISSGGRGGGGGRGGRAPAVLAGVAGNARAAVTTDATPVITTVANGKFSLRTDTNGILFLSNNSGMSWKAVKGTWKGKVVRLVSPADAPGANGAVFQLSTDSGEIWFSKDGNRWDPAKK